MKWWFSDYDGTINLSHNDNIDQRDLNFIKKWIADGNKFAIATGRMHHEIAPILEKNQIPYDYMVCNNGAMAFEKNTGILYHTIIPMEARPALLAVMQKLQDRFTLGYCEFDKRMDYSHVYTEEIDSNHFFKNAPKQNNLETGAKAILTSPDLNLVYIYLNQADIAEVKEAFSQVPGCKVIRTHTNVIEVMSAEVSKAHGINEIQKIHNFANQDIVASGDG